MLGAPTATPGPERRPRPVRSPTALGVSMLLLLLSAIHEPDHGASLLDPRAPNAHGGSGFGSGAHSFAHRQFLLQTPHLAYVASIASGDDFDLGSVLSLGNGDGAGSDTDSSSSSASSTGVRRHRLRRASVAVASSEAGDSTAGASNDVTDEHDLSSAAPSSGRVSPIAILGAGCGNNVSTVAPPATRVASLADLPAEALGAALSFLTAAELETCRAASGALDTAAEAACVVTKAAPRGFRFLIVDPDAPCRAAESARRFGSSWCCAACAAHNAHMAESCRTCKAANGTVRRVFLGQLRKERTAELAHFLVAHLFPDVEVIHIESHTNAADGRGKGCAWVYVGSDADAQKLLTLHKRMYVDFDETTQREGVWICDAANVEALAGFAARRAYTPMRPSVMPRQPVVVELPKGAPAVSAVVAAAAAAPAAVTPLPTRNRRRPAANRATFPIAATAAAPVVGAPFFNYHARPAAAPSAGRRVTAEHYLPDAEAAFVVASAPAVSYDAAAACPCEACAAAAADANAAAMSAATTFTHNPYSYFQPQPQPAAAASRFVAPSSQYGYHFQRSYAQQQQQQCMCEDCLHQAW